MARKKKKLKLKIPNTYAFVVDGETEVWYLQMLKRNERSLSVNIEPKLPSKKTLSEQFDLVISSAENYTKVFWIVDYDVISKETKEAKKGGETAEQEFIRLRKLAIKNDNVIVIVNNPCLEFWFLIHFKKTSRLFSNCISVEVELRQYLADYEKTKAYFTREGNDIYLKLKDKIQYAIENSDSLNGFDQFETSQAFCEMSLFFKEEKINTVVCK